MVICRLFRIDKLVFNLTVQLELAIALFIAIVLTRQCFRIRIGEVAFLLFLVCSVGPFFAHLLSEAEAEY